MASLPNSQPFDQQSGAALFSRVPPHSTEAERSVLACALSSEKLLAQVVSQVREDDFYEPIHRIIFEAIRNLMNQRQAVDVITVMDQLSRMNRLDDIGGIQYLNQLLDAAPSLSNAENYARIVHQKSLLRQIILALDLCREACYTHESADDVLDLAAAKLFEVREDSSYGHMRRLGDVISDVINKLFAMYDSKESHLGISSGFPSLDQPLSGLRKGTLNVIAARPAMGKSALAINIAHRVALLGKKNVALFSMEMSQEEIANRVLASQAMIPSELLNDATRLESKDFDEISKAMKKLYDIGFYIDDQSNTTPMQILSKCRQLRVENRAMDLVIIDYLQLMNCDGRHDSRQQEISEISRNLKLLAKELQIPVIALSQLSRACEQRQNKRPLLSDLRESGSIEQDADSVLFIYRESYYTRRDQEAPKEEAEIIIAKNRAGKTATVRLEWLSQYTTFLDPNKHQLTDADAPPEHISRRAADYESLEGSGPAANLSDEDFDAGYEPGSLPKLSSEDVPSGFGDLDFSPTDSSDIPF
ncbi:MAG: replicative DNA helicase [Eubacteriales bacterium]|nr:replicative DNA helicase [Eubacteriales bacterium]